ncbi:hypothetical protein AWE51_14655 [Aquimarina aggregata]|uniref:Right handed beta helix domain-containing protein n=1 Tax=Aquimarina aggregata TaxID=1642818 RepID=A0A162XXD2_9FLAO|nr:hypothetical protein [Aquimarina aggregata]KZS38820.1 hypothetical protein AWE51_14655 [Aquimarina aggregata]
MKTTSKNLKNLLLLLVVIALGSCSNDLEDLDKTLSDSNIDIEKKIPSEFQNQNFYNPPASNIRKVQFTGTTTAQLNQLIKQNSKANGPGVIIEIPRRTYNWNEVILKSNIHLQIAEGTIIKFDGTRGGVFSIGAARGGKRLKNVSISGQDGRKFMVDISASNLVNKNVNAVKIGRVDNFRIADINIKDRRSSVNSIVLVHVGGASENRPGPADGVIENIKQTGSHTGYGLIQTYNANNVLFKNLNCDGGVTLRMETDDIIMKGELKNGSKKGGINDVFAYNINNTNGITAVMFSPHFVKNGNVTVEKVKATGSTFAVRVEKGFLELFDLNDTFPINNDGQRRFEQFIQSQFNINGTALSGRAYKRNNGRRWAVRLSPAASIAPRNTFVKNQLGEIGNGLEAGGFTNAKVKNITAKFQNDRGAKIKQIHLQFIPCNIWANGLRNPGTSLNMFNGFEYHGPSVALSYDNTANGNTGGNYRVTLERQQFNGFPNGFTQNIKFNITTPACGNNANTITNYIASFPN